MDEQRENENLVQNPPRNYGPQEPQEQPEVQPRPLPVPRLQQLRQCLIQFWIYEILLVLALCFSLTALGLGAYSYKVLQIHTTLHTTYEKIGSTSCDGVTGTSTMFTGLTVGFVTETGATEYKCVLKGDDDKIKIQYYNDISLSAYTDEKEVKFLNVTKYKTFRVGKSDFDVSCSQCSVSGRYVIYMVPGRIECIDDTWTKEYDGYLMTDEGSTTFRCVDSGMDAPTDTYHPGNNNPILRHVVLSNTITDHFQSNKVLSCVVCSK